MRLHPSAPSADHPRTPAPGAHRRAPRTPVPRTPAPGAHRRARIAVVPALLAAGALTLSACASPAAGDGAASSPSEQTTVSFALDWAPNTNHIGLYAADALGLFEEAGIDLEILPHGSAGSAQLVSAGEADFGVAGQSSVQVGRTAGLDIVSVLSVTQTDTGRLVTLPGRADRPSDLDGAVFGGFGSPLYGAIAETVLRGDGGEGSFDEVVLDTGAYEALTQGRIEFTLSVSTWENLQAEIDGHPYTAFSYQDYGLPQQQSTGIVSSDAFIDAHPETAAAFVQALQQGYAYAAEHPDEAADMLLEANRDTLAGADELVHRSAELLAGEGYLVAEGRAIGEPDPAAWEEFGAFLVERGFLVDADGETVTDAPDWSEYYTADLLG